MACPTCGREYQEPSSPSPSPTREASSEVQAALRSLIEQWRVKSKQYLKLTKAYTCKSQEGIKHGLVKGSAILKMCADDVESALQNLSVEATKEVPATEGTPVPDVPTNWADNGGLHL